MDEIDRRIVVATQNGLPLTPRPYADVAQAVECSEDEVMGRLLAMQAQGVVRRIGAVPNHYVIGVRANAMSVWDVRDDIVGALGPRVGALDFVTHCYRRPRRLPDWPYNLFAMVHGRDRTEVDAKVQAIAVVLGDADRGHDLLYSTRILKKTGLRLAG
jgi:DNA-binding Lrp family transcriptional regulator